MAASSPIWFDCWVPGTLTTLFLGSFSPNQIPLPQVASSLLFLLQLPSVYTVIGFASCPCSHLGFAILYAGCWGSPGLLARTRKHSSSEFLDVIVGSKYISSPFSIICSFLVFLQSPMGEGESVFCWMKGNTLHTTGQVPAT